MTPSLSDTQNETAPQTGQAPVGDKETYREILKSSALIGGSSMINVGIGIVRTKAMAVLLGPVGFGLAGLYNSIVNLTQSVAGMGISGSGVRQIAAAVGSEDTVRIAQTTAVLRRTALVLATLGALLLASLAKPVSWITFGSYDYTTAICILAFAAFFQVVSAGQSALIQGIRRIGDLARIAVFSSLFGTVATIPIIYFFREQGIAPSIAAVGLMSLAASWWYSKQVKVVTPTMSLSDIRREATALLKLGFAFMATGLMLMAVGYFVRILVLRELGYEATGLYQSAWSIGSLYAGFILQAMGSDFYPRLTAKADDNSECNRLVNEQAYIGLLLAGPGLLATLTFAPLVIAVFYSAKFAAAVGLLRWICLGTLLQVIIWPMGFIIVAKGRQTLFFCGELAQTVVSLTLAWLCIKWFRLTGAGIAFFGAYLFYVFLIYIIVRRLSGFRWSRVNRELGLVYLALTVLTFGSYYVMPNFYAAVLGILLSIGSGIYSVRRLLKLVSLERLPAFVRQPLSWVGGLST